MPMNEYGEIIRKHSPQLPSNGNNKYKKIIIGIIVGIVVSLAIASVIIIPIFIKYQKSQIKDLQTKIIGKDYEVTNSHTEMFTHFRETWKIHFNDNNTLEYYYIDQYSWISDPPKYYGTYNYTLSGPLGNEYKLKTNGKTFIIKVDKNNNVRSSWQWDNYVIHDIRSSNE